MRVCVNRKVRRAEPHHCSVAFWIPGQPQVFYLKPFKQVSWVCVALLSFSMPVAVCVRVRAPVFK